MKSFLGRITLAMAVLGLGIITWFDARSARGMADGYERLATFRFDPGQSSPPPLVTRVTAQFGDAADEPRRQQATGQYWLGRYDLLTTAAPAAAGPANDDDADVMFVAANAAFRAAGPMTAVNVTHVARLDVVLAGYAAVLKAEPDHADAAWNYEYVARIRDRASRTPAPLPPKLKPGEKPPPPAPPPPVPRLTMGDLPGGPTIHGRPGGPPPATRGEEFQIITPMEYGERESQPEASPGGKLPRKG